MPRVMFLANSVSGGGAELATRLLASKLDSTEFPCSFVAINDWPDDEAAPSSGMIRLGRSYQGNLFNLGSTILKFSLLVRKQKPDFLVINCELPELFSLFAPIRCKRIVVEHTSKPWGRLRLLGLAVRRILGLLDTTWVSVSSNKSIWSVGSNEGIYIPNPTVHNLPKVFYNEKEIKRLFYVGRLNSIKQPEFVVRASKISGIPAILIGDGPELESIQKWITEEDLKVTMTGHSLTPWNLLREGDVVVVPSLYEGDGLVVSEAVIIGTPILLLDVPDLRKFDLKDANYFEDFPDLIRKIQKYKFEVSEITPDDKTRNLQVEARSPEFVVRKWEQLFRGLPKAP